MKHNQLNTDVAAIRRAYGQFLDKGEVAKGLVPDFIERSWRRSAAFDVPSDRIHEVGRVTDADLRRVANQYGSLINLAAPVMENLHHQLMGTGSVVVLCAGDGLILHSMGDPDFLPKAEQVALKPGVSWAEQQKGTNAIRTAMRLGCSILPAITAATSATPSRWWRWRCALSSGRCSSFGFVATSYSTFTRSGITWGARSMCRWRSRRAGITWRLRPQRAIRSASGRALSAAASMTCSRRRSSRC